MFERLKELREYDGYSMKQIASKIGIKKNTYSTWEYGDIIPLKHIISLANIYQVKIDYIMDLTNDNSKINKLYNRLDKNIIAKNLLKFRIDNKLIQEKIAKSIHINNATWSRYETGNLLITTMPLYELCKKYNLSVENILFNQ